MVQFRKLSAFIALFLPAVYSCNAPSRSKLITVTLQQEWFPYSGFAGELTAMHETDSLHGLNIDLHAGSENIDPIKLVISGTRDFGVAPADRILAADQKGARLVVIGVIESRSPVCFLTKAKDHILSPKDFPGKKAGVIAGVQSELVYRTLLAKQGIKMNQVKEVNIPFGLETFLLGQYDIRPAFIYNETLVLEDKHIPFNTIKPEQYGVTFLGSVYFTTQDYIDKHPQLVQAFISSIADGWKKALTNPAKSISYLKQFDHSIDSVREYRSLIMAKDYYQPAGERLLYASKKDWQAMYAHLKDLKVITNVDLAKSVDDSFINNWANH